jgi:hypothetical protein
MPVTVKLSRKFYDTLGDEITNELVDWFNKMDATSRSDLRELNALNFARFDAKLEQRAAQLEAKIEQRIAEVRAEMRTGFAEQRAAMVKWMFLFWAANAATTAGLVLTLAGILMR